MVERIRFAAVPRWVRDRLQGRDGTVWVGIDGFGAAGKSTLAAAVAVEVPRAVVVHIDDFARPGMRGWEQARFLAQVVSPLRAGQTARYQRWDWEADAGAEWYAIEPGQVVICEGVSSTDVSLEVPWDLTLWVEASYAVRLARARARDGEALLPMWLEEWMPSEEAYAAAQQPWKRVDAVVVA